MPAQALSKEETMRAAHQSLRPMIKACFDQGFRPGGRGQHTLWLLGPDGTSTVSVPKTPSDHRSGRNFVARARRMGLVWPPPRAESDLPPLSILADAFARVYELAMNPQPKPDTVEAHGETPTIDPTAGKVARSQRPQWMELVGRRDVLPADLLFQYLKDQNGRAVPSTVARGVLGWGPAQMSGAISTAVKRGLVERVGYATRAETGATSGRTAVKIRAKDGAVLVPLSVRLSERSRQAAAKRAAARNGKVTLTSRVEALIAEHEQNPEPVEIPEPEVTLHPMPGPVGSEVEFEERSVQRQEPVQELTFAGLPLGVWCDVFQSVADALRRHV